MRSKDEVRAEVWQAMEEKGVSRFPGAEGRIPNFAGDLSGADQKIVSETNPPAAPVRTWFDGSVAQPSTHRV